MRAPDHPADITRDWVEYMLTDYEDKANTGTTVEVDSFTINNGLKPGDGFAGQLVALDVKAKVTPKSKEATCNKEYHLMVKMMNASPMDREFNRLSGTDIRELKIYQEVMDELNKFQEEHGNNEFQLALPKVYYGKCTQNEFVMVMENLKFEGYDTVATETGLNGDQLKLAVDYLAKLHAVSYAYDKKKSFLEKFPHFKNDLMTKRFFHFATNVGIMNTKTFLKTVSGKENLVKKIEKQESTLVNEYNEEMSDQTSPKVMCLIHGDLWVKNLMFKFGLGEKGEQITKAMHVLDWQRAYWNSSVLDLHFIFYTSTTKEVRDEHLEDLLRQYHSVFTAATNKLGTPVLNWNYEGFKAEYDRLQVFGILRGLIITQLLLSEFGSKFSEKQQSAGTGQKGWFKKIVDKLTVTILVPILTSWWFQPIHSMLITIVFKALGTELVEGKRPAMNKRILGIVEEAEEMGFFDRNKKKA
ncbi:unnamed protein product [Meganyctiphanes norvegica]|uniref:CHK kinase-like domain-containing protein n=1 Tax=Meganyctiphanes norvegica TaxID=48144 RepID=A0AAV2PSG4_MEGNR